MTVPSALLDLPTRTLLDKFGMGKHVPGSGSAAALMGLLSAQLLVTVASLTLGKKNYRDSHPAIEAARRDIDGRLYPKLVELFQSDAEVFDTVIANRKSVKAPKEAVGDGGAERAGDKSLKLATDIPFQIAEACLDLAAHAVLIFDRGFKSARGDSGAGLSVAFAGANSAVFIVNLNLQKFRGTYWARQQRLRCDELRKRLKEMHAAASDRIGVLRMDDLEEAKGDELAGKFQITLRESYTLEQLEEAARRLQVVLWKNQLELRGVVSEDPVDTFDPEAALDYLGFSCEFEETLGTFNAGTGNFEVAGIFDANVGRVRLSRQFPTNEQLFTAAHELGHAVLHPRMDGAHRDRPKSGASVEREPREWEADKFATFFLMPTKLVKTRFAENFGEGTFVLDDDTAFHLGGWRLEEARAKFPTVRDLTRHLVAANRYAGRPIVSLQEQLRVSPESLAIRLEEVGVVRLRHEA